MKDGNFAVAQSGGPTAAINATLCGVIECAFSCEKNIYGAKNGILGVVNDVCECEYYGDEIEIGFNYKYLHDAVSRCEGEEIELKMNSPFNPLIINSVDDDKSLFMVLPVRI